MDTYEKCLRRAFSDSCGYCDIFPAVLYLAMSWNRDGSEHGRIRAMVLREEITTAAMVPVYVPWNFDTASSATAHGSENGEEGLSVPDRVGDCGLRESACCGSLYWMAET